MTDNEENTTDAQPMSSPNFLAMVAKLGEIVQYRAKHSIGGASEADVRAVRAVQEVGTQYARARDSYALAYAFSHSLITFLLSDAINFTEVCMKEYGAERDSISDMELEVFFKQWEPGVSMIASYLAKYLSMQPPIFLMIKEIYEANAVEADEGNAKALHVIASEWLGEAKKELLEMGFESVLDMDMHGLYSSSIATLISITNEAEVNRALKEYNIDTPEEPAAEAATEETK